MTDKPHIATHKAKGLRRVKYAAKNAKQRFDFWIENTGSFYSYKFKV